MKLLHLYIFNHLILHFYSINYTFFFLLLFPLARKIRITFHFFECRETLSLFFFFQFSKAKEIWNLCLLKDFQILNFLINIPFSVHRHVKKKKLRIFKTPPRYSVYICMYSYHLLDVYTSLLAFIVLIFFLIYF